MIIRFLHMQISIYYNVRHKFIPYTCVNTLKNKYKVINLNTKDIIIF